MTVTDLGGDDRRAGERGGSAAGGSRVPAARSPAPSRARRGAPSTHTEWRLIETPAYSGSRNMAIDVAFAESVRQGGQPILRFYRWWPPCISLGRNQMARDQYDTDEARRRGIDFVRRPTGGRAVFHHHEVTYSVVVGDRALGGPRRTYYMIHRALQAGLRLLGVPAELAGHASPALRPSTVPCFQGPDGGAIMVADRKLVGSAQLRERGVILQHGSILLAGDQAHARELLKVRRDRDVTPPPAALKELLPTIPRWQELVDTLALGFERVLGVRLSDATLDRAEMQRAVEAVGQFEDPEWTWRR